MSTLVATALPASASPNTVAPRSIASMAPLVRLLAGVTLASALAGGVATLALERLLDAVAPRASAAAAAARAPTAAAAAPDSPTSASPGLPAVHDVMTDRAEPPIEPPPAS